jgi:hypothetical protein
MVNLLPFWQHYLGPLLRSNVFIVLATFLAGYIVWRVYQNQLADEKRSAANVVLLEIEGAEEALKKVTTDKPFSEERLVLMETASWDKYKHLFVSDFIGFKDEWNKITDFYSQCKGYDEAVVGQNEMTDYNTKQMIVNQQRILSDFALKHNNELAGESKDEKSKAALKQEYKAKRTQFVDVYTGIVSRDAPIDHYTPVRFYNDAKRILGIVDRNLSTSTAGVRLKELATHRTRRFQTHRRTDIDKQAQ